MADNVKISFAALTATPGDLVVLLATEGGAEAGPLLAPAGAALLAPSGDLLARAAAADRFEGKSGSSLDLLAPAGVAAARVIVVGVGKAQDLKPLDWLKLGGTVMGKLPASAKDVSIVVELPAGEVAPEAAAEIALGLRLRGYAFDRYKTKKKPEEASARLKATLHVADDSAAKRVWKKREGDRKSVV